MKKLKDVLKKVILLGLPIIIFILCLFSDETSQAAKKALYLCIDVVIPSLFPFFTLSGIIMPYVSRLNCPNIFKRLIEKFLRLPYYTILIILLGFVSGYPNGAKMTRDMFNNELIDSKQATRLLTVSNYCSPLFIMGTIGAGLFKSIKLGMFLLLIHWLSGILAALITSKITDSRYRKRNIKEQRIGGKDQFYKQDDQRKNRSRINSINNNIKELTPIHFSVLLTSSIESAAILCVKLTGYIVFFAVIAELLSLLGVFSFLCNAIVFLFPGSSQSFSALLASTLRGFLEITSGAQAINQVKGIQLNMQLAAISLIFGFAGFSAHAQVIGIMNGTDSKYKVFFISKVLHGIIASAMAFITIYAFPITVETATVGTQPTITWTWGRPVVVLILLASLIVSPYRVKGINKKSRGY